MTPEVRAQGLRRAAEERERLKRAGEGLKQDFLDKNHWLALTSAKGVRMPPRYYPCEIKKMRRFLRKINKTEQSYVKAVGVNLSYFIKNNPKWPLWAWLGATLETINES